MSYMRKARQKSADRTALGKNYILRGSGANVARGSFCSLGGVLSPPTPASSAFLFPDPLEYDFSMTGGLLGVRKTEEVGVVGDDLTCVRREGEEGEASGVGDVTDSEGGTRSADRL